MTIETFSSANIDFTAVSTAFIFTPASDFIVTGVTFIGIDVTGSISYPSISFGTNSPNFDNFAITQSDVDQTDLYQFYSIGGTVNPIVQSGGSFEAVIVVPDTTATTNTQRIDISGYYM